MLKGWRYYVGHFGYTHKECYANDGASFINVNGYPCESLWIKEGCTVYFQPCNLGDPLPHRAVLAGSLAYEDRVYVAFLDFNSYNAFQVTTERQTAMQQLLVDNLKYSTFWLI